MPERPAAVQTVLIENDRIRVSRWQFAPGAATGWHRHEYDYVVVPMSTGRLASSGPAGDSVAELVTGLPYFRNAGVALDLARGCVLVLGHPGPPLAIVTLSCRPWLISAQWRRFGSTTIGCG